jgi:hypothetical protein
MSEKEDPIIVKCPHCEEYIEIIEINCAIFRHGIFKNTAQQIDPHTPKQICDQYIKTNAIYGCGKPFKIIFRENNLVAEICDYI